jgi:hypothetical protein
MAGYNSGRGGARKGAGRPKPKTPTKVLRVPSDVTKDEVEAIPSIKASMASWYELIEEEPDSPRYHFLKHFLADLEALGISPK